MKINDILECFNKVLDYGGNPGKIHYVAHNTIERKIGAVKTATTIISLCMPDIEPEEIIKEEYTTSVPNGYEETLIEETQKRALIEFIKRWHYDSRVK